MNKRFEKELDFFLYGTYEPKRFPESNQVLDEHTGLRVLNWRCRVNKPEYKMKMVEHFYNLALEDVRKEVENMKAPIEYNKMEEEAFRSSLSTVIDFIDDLTK